MHDTTDRRHTRRTTRHHRRSINEIATTGWQNARVGPRSLPTLYHRSELWRRSRDNCDPARSIGCRLAAGIGNRLSDP